MGDFTSRRSLLRGGLATGGVIVAGAAGAGAPRGAPVGNPANQPPNIPDWTRSLGEGVAVRGYGRPAEYEKGIIRRDVEWLTASRESSVSFTPVAWPRRTDHAQRALLRAPSFRNCRGRSRRLRWPILSGGASSIASHDPVKSIGSYWPYASTVIDYIRRTMPFGASQTLTNDGLYAITAYVFFLNDIVKSEDFELSDKNFMTIKLPKELNFSDDDWETAEKAFRRKDPCMSNCAPGKAAVTGRARVIDVTPEPGQGPKVE
jgi:hypothetical protein